MRNGMCLFVLMILSLFIVTTSVEAANSVPQYMINKAKKGKQLSDKERLQLAKAGYIDKRGKWIGDSKVTAADRPAQGNRVNQGYVTPDDPRPAEMRPHRLNGGGWGCNEGYYCVADHGGLTTTCKLDRYNQHTRAEAGNCTNVSLFCQNPDSRTFDAELWEQICNG